MILEEHQMNETKLNVEYVGGLSSPFQFPLPQIYALAFIFLHFEHILLSGYYAVCCMLRTVFTY